MRVNVWLLAAAVDVSARQAESLAEEAVLSARLMAADGLLLAAEPEEELSPRDREALHYASFVMSYLACSNNKEDTSCAVSEYNVDRIQCAEKCDGLGDACEGFTVLAAGPEDRVCRLYRSRDVRPGRSQAAEDGNLAEFAYVKRESMPLPHAVMKSFSNGWHGLTNNEGQPTPATPANPWWTATIPSSLEFDLNFETMLTAITIANVNDAKHGTGADQIDVYAKKTPDKLNPDGWLLVGHTRLFAGEELKLPVEACHTRFVRIDFKTFHGDPGAVNISKIVMSGGIAISPDRLSDHKALLDQRKAREAALSKHAGMQNCPLISTYSAPTLAQFATWAVQQADCLCAEVTNVQTRGNTDQLIADQIQRWHAQVTSGDQFASEMFGPLFGQSATRWPAEYHYSRNREAWINELHLNATDYEAFKAASADGVPPPLRYYIFQPAGTRGKSRGVQIGGLHFFYKGKPVDMTGVKAHALTGSVPEGKGPENLWDDKADTIYFNTVVDAPIVFEFPGQVIVDSFTLTSADTNPWSDPIMWTLLGGYDGEEWPFLLNMQEVTGPVPAERGKTSIPILLRSILLDNEHAKDHRPGQEKPVLKGLDAIKAMLSRTEYPLKEGEEHLYSEQVPAQCVAMSCLSYQIARTTEGCRRHLQPVCDRFAAETKCPQAHCGTDAYPGFQTSSCVQIVQQSKELTDHYLAGAVNEAEDLKEEHEWEQEQQRLERQRLLDEKREAEAGKNLWDDDVMAGPASESSLGERNHLRLVVTPTGQVAEQ